MIPHYTLKIRGKIIGEIDNITDDMPNTIGSFHPTQHYAEYQDRLMSVSEISHRLAESDWLKMMLQLDSEGLELCHSDGMVFKFRPPYALASPGFAYLRLNNGKIWWRPC